MALAWDNYELLHRVKNVFIENSVKSQSNGHNFSFGGNYLNSPRCDNIVRNVVRIMTFTLIYRVM